MNCSEREELIALWVEGDLEERRASLVENHLTTCASCREFAEALRASQAELKDLRGEEPERAALAEIRQGVLARISPARPSWLYAWRWKHALAGATIVVAATAPLWFRSRPPDRPFPVAPRDNRVGQVGQAIPPASEAKPRAVLRRRQQVRTPGSKFEFARIEPVRIEPTRIDPPLKPDPLVVKLVTDDPEVVIVWLIDRNGDSL